MYSKSFDAVNWFAALTNIILFGASTPANAANEIEPK